MSCSKNDEEKKTPDLRLGNVFQLPRRRISRRWSRSGTNLGNFLEAPCAQTTLFWSEMMINEVYTEIWYTASKFSHFREARHIKWNWVRLAAREEHISAWACTYSKSDLCPLMPVVLPLALLATCVFFPSHEASSFGTINAFLINCNHGQVRKALHNWSIRASNFSEVKQRSHMQVYSSRFPSLKPKTERWGQ